MKNKFFRLISLTVFLLLTAAAMNAQNPQMLAVSADDLQNGKAIALDKLAWKYQASDDLNWANPEFDES